MRSVWYSTQSWRNEISKGFKLDFNVTFMDTTDHFFLFVDGYFLPDFYIFSIKSISLQRFLTQFTNIPCLAGKTFQTNYIKNIHSYLFGKNGDPFEYLNKQYLLSIMEFLIYKQKFNDLCEDNST